MSKIPLYYLAPILIWGVSWYAIKLNIDGDTPKNFSIAMRFLIASILLFGFCFLTKKNLRLTKADNLFVALQALLLFTVNYFFFYMAIDKGVSSGIVGVISSTIMFLNILNGRFILKLPVKKSSVILSFVGLSGIVLIFQSELKGNIADNEKIWGLACAFIGSYMTSLGNTVSSFNQKKKRSVVVSNAYGMLYASLIMFCIFFSSGEKFILDLSGNYIPSLLFLAVGTSAISYGCYLSLVGMVGPAKAAYVFFLTPIIALTVSTLNEEGYTWNWEGGLGVFIILAGCLVLLISESKKKKELSTEK